MASAVWLPVLEPCGMLQVGGVEYARPSHSTVMSRSLCAYQVPGTMPNTSTLHVLLQLLFTETLFGGYLY